MIPGLNARGFSITAESDQKVEAVSGNNRITITDSTISFRGVSLARFLGVEAPDEEDAALRNAGAILELL